MNVAKEMSVHMIKERERERERNGDEVIYLLVRRSSISSVFLLSCK